MRTSLEGWTKSLVNKDSLRKPLVRRSSGRKEKKMKKIINGKKYDTDAAEYLVLHRSRTGTFEDYDEVLYRTKTGEFFLAGKGGPLSKYRQKEGNGWRNGERIIPLKEGEAKAWVEENANDKYEEIFGKVEE